MNIRKAAARFAQKATQFGFFLYGTSARLAAEPLVEGLRDTGREVLVWDISPRTDGTEFYGSLMAAMQRGAIFVIRGMDDLDLHLQHMVELAVNRRRIPGAFEMCEAIDGFTVFGVSYRSTCDSRLAACFMGGFEVREAKAA